MIKRLLSLIGGFVFAVALNGAVAAYAYDYGSTPTHPASGQDTLACQKTEQATHTANIDAAHKAYKTAMAANQKTYKEEKAAKNPDARKHYQAALKVARKTLTQALTAENARFSAAMKACTAAKKTPESTPVSADNTVTLINYSFEPATLNVTVGTVVTWKQGDSANHQVVADDGSFEGPVMKWGDVFTHTFDTAGTYDYHCKIHPSMKGTIVVK